MGDLKMDFKKKVDECIEELIDDFMKNPDDYINEGDMVHHLSRKLHNKMEEKLRNKEMFLLHREYPTSKKKGETKKHFDIVILDKSSHDKIYTQNEINIVIEFKVNYKETEGKIINKIKHDLDKMTDKEVKVKNRYFI